MAEVDVFTRLIYYAMQAGLTHAEACDELPVSEVCHFVTCHWESMGLEVQPLSCKDTGMKQAAIEKLAQISNRDKKWLLERN